ncbi:receptor-type tyrosine-protein phosphatase alpha-like isoform X2 [Saccostrea cucullata]|uniref:receptor-type tyrosine-protein phosphatase alpha-like isoform X2 n=1 Tax=Saccostrea cuccullata TaxID=36930 RepID=UPI002ED54410
MWLEVILLNFLISIFPEISGFVNLAHTPGQKLQGTASWNVDAHPSAGGADKVVDGDTRQGYLPTCAIADYGAYTYKSVWWKVWLDRKFNIAYLEVYLRSGTTMRATGFSLYTYDEVSYEPPNGNSGSLIFKHDPMSECPKSFWNITVNTLAQGIAFYNERPRGFRTSCTTTDVTKTSIEICEVRVMGCDQNRYDFGCRKPCDAKCKDSHCDVFNGSCIYGCSNPDAVSIDCVCEDGKYAFNGRCEPCGHCQVGTVCDKGTGRCPSGCNEHWSGDLCKECADGYYGQNCGSTCGNCLQGFCDKKSGTCLSNCKPNWKEPLCQECVDGYYDQNCRTQCGNCREGHCDKTTGHCPSGCKLNWKEPLCQECVDDYYGLNCSTKCGNCLEGFCDKKNGSCQSGCKQNWNKPLCQECVDGFFDKDCSTRCGHCLTGVCDKTDGTCMSGCSLNWQEPLCQECVDGFYFEDCSKSCGECLGEVCEKKNGFCKSGCLKNWQEPLCQEYINGFYDQNCSTQCGNCRTEFCDKKNGSCLNGCKTNWGGPLCKVLAERQDEEENNAAIIGGIVPVILIAVLIGVLILIFYRRYKNNGGKEGLMENDKHFGRKADGGRHGKDNETEFFDEVCNPGTSQADENGYYNTDLFITNINIGDLRNVINEKNMGENSQFRQEYKRLPPANLSVCQSAQKTENKAKNRFKTTFPYEHSRIILKEMWTDSDNDYINANFISDCNGENRYIAAQGPRDNTLRDFWRMIWQENIKDIIMLTNLVEKGKNKCSQYWPDKDKSIGIGLCTISLREETVYAFHTLRKLSVERKDPPSKRTITQFHYTAWPDHGTPQELELVQFHRFVSRRIHTDVPLLVHCSAGVGRTGTFIGLDSLLTQGRDTGRINVFEFVKQMRENRMTMVQTPEQYIFLHEALNCGFQGDFLLSRDEFPTKSEALLNDNAPLNQRALYKEFKVLETLTSNSNFLADEVATSVENTKKNFSQDILPVSKFRPYLTTYVKGRNDYINAVMVPSYKNPAGLIITQKPLPDTEMDLWRLCFDHEVNALVVLNAKNEANGWFPKRGSSKACVPFTLTAGGTGSNISGVSQDHVVISGDNVKKEIEVFQVQTDDNDTILKATELVLEKEKQSPFTSVVISKDGAGPAGILCVLHNALQQISMDGEVDIFTIVRQLKVRRPEVITTLEEYRRCYQLVSQSVSTEGIYANM